MVVGPTVHAVLAWLLGPSGFLLQTQEDTAPPPNTLLDWF